jgi:prophage regulatory protein
VQVTTQRPDTTRENFMRMPEVLKCTRLSRPTIYRRMAKGEFPKAVQIGANSVAWRASDIDRWMLSPMCWSPAA